MPGADRYVDRSARRRDLPRRCLGRGGAAKGVPGQGSDSQRLTTSGPGPRRARESVFHTSKSIMHTNRLANEQSPYLLQHANNPVDWFAWGEEAFEKARRENK